MPAPLFPPVSVGAGLWQPFGPQTPELPREAGLHQVRSSQEAREVAPALGAWSLACDPPWGGAWGKAEPALPSLESFCLPMGAHSPHAHAEQTACGGWVCRGVALRPLAPAPASPSLCPASRSPSSCAVMAAVGPRHYSLLRAGALRGAHWGGHGCPGRLGARPRLWCLRAMRPSGDLAQTASECGPGPLSPAGLSCESWSIMKNMATELGIILIGYFTLVPAIQVRPQARLWAECGCPPPQHGASPRRGAPSCQGGGSAHRAPLVGQFGRSPRCALAGRGVTLPGRQAPCLTLTPYPPPLSHREGGHSVGTRGLVADCSFSQAWLPISQAELRGGHEPVPSCPP